MKDKMRSGRKVLKADILAGGRHRGAGVLQYKVVAFSQSVARICESSSRERCKGSLGENS